MIENLLNEAVEELRLLRNALATVKEGSNDKNADLGLATKIPSSCSCGGLSMEEGGHSNQSISSQSSICDRLSSLKSNCKSEDGGRNVNKSGKSSGKSKVKCQICGSWLSSIHTLQDHMDQHSDSPRRQCNSCNAFFYTRFQLRNHRKKCQGKNSTTSNSSLY